MTKDEANKLLGDAAAELAGVKKNLHCLETKAEGYIRVLTQASEAIKGSLGGSEDAGVPDAMIWPSVDHMETLCNDINEAKTRRHQLTMRLREWGVID